MGLDLLNAFNWRLTASIAVICISQINFGFDNSGYSSIQSLDKFEEQFGKWDPKKQTYYLPTQWLSMFNSFGFLGLACGVIIGSMVSKRFGRRWCMFCMSCWALVTATITITSKTSDQIMVSRVLNFIYIGMELAVVPIFQSEITPKQARGFVVGTYQLMLTIGGLAINGICYNTQYRPDNSAFRIPFGIFFVIPSIVVCSIWFIPESPRWLALNNRTEEALESLTLLRKGKFTEEEIEEEFQEILAHVEHEREKEQGVFKDMFRGSNRRRTAVILIINFFLQATGQSFVSQYGALFIKSLGTVNQFTMNMIMSCVSCLVAIGAMFAVDTIGRRRMLIIGGIVQSAALLAMGGLGTAEPTYSIKTAIVAMMVLSIAGYTFGWAPVVHTLSAELPAGDLRDVTYRSGSIVNVLTNFTVAFTLPYLLDAPYANLQSKVGFIYGSISVCSIFFAYLFVPDCRGRSLEDVNRLFESGAPARQFHKITLDRVHGPADDLDKDKTKVAIEQRAGGV
ncbi:general substrate transporter [Xylariaceae sp. FL0804]|nr:general substrate transporter [Xylariaceae sp. FL0804]